MSLLLVLIAIPGVAAVLLRLGIAVFWIARYSIERFVASQIAGRRAQRGDLSGMTAAEIIRRSSRRRQLHGLLRVLLWSGVLLAPLWLPGSLLIYALYTLLWLVPLPGSAQEAG
ncbi:MAG: hypothetical protein ACT443_01505 [Gemmatimonadota bacterium]